LVGYPCGCPANYEVWSVTPNQGRTQAGSCASETFLRSVLLHFGQRKSISFIWARIHSAVGHATSKPEVNQKAQPRSTSSKTFIFTKNLVDERGFEPPASSLRRQTAIGTASDKRVREWPYSIELTVCCAI
jgi:hypothetical protein